MKHIFTAFYIIFFQLSLAGYAQMSLPNPVLAGYYPDPSICKVGTDYYLVNSTFAYFPGIPVFHSKDLKNWKQAGNVIDRPSQMDFLGSQVSQGLFAPAIRFYKDTYYVTCTNINGGGNFVVTAKDPAGPWSNPVWLKEVRGIDPSLFFDDNGKAYIVYNSDAPDFKPLYDGHRTIRLYEFDLVNLKVTGSESILVNGGTDISKKPVWIEGPHIYKRDGWYYLMAAEGGTSTNHSEVIFRSRDVRGPFVPYEKNPILTQRDIDPDRKNPITSTGHADLVEGPDGNTYAVFLGTRPYEGDYYNTGRETFIAPVKWADGWPVINPGHREVQYHYPVTWKEVKQKNALPMNGNFSYTLDFRDSLSSQFVFLRTHNPNWYSLNIRKDYLTMKLLPATVMERGNPAFIGKRQQHLTCSASTEMDFSAKQENEKAGLLIFQNETHFYFICKSREGGNEVIQLYKGNPDTQKMDLLKQAVLTGTAARVFLKIMAEKDKYSFWYGLEKDNWKLLEGNVDGKFLSTAVAGGFVGSFFAMYATSEGKPSDNSAAFKWFGYSGNDETYR